MLCNKNMKMNKLITAIVLTGTIVFNAGNTSAQSVDNKWSIGFYGGLTRLNSDFKNHYFDLRNTEKFARLSLSTFLTPHFNLNLSLGTGDVSTYNTRVQQSVTTTVRPVDLTLQFNLLSSSEPLVPYVFAGGGVIYADNYLSRSQYAVNIPMGLGLRYNAFPNVSFDANVRQDATLSDELDGYKAGTWKDNVLTYSAGVVFNLGGSADADKDGVSDKKDKCAGTPAGVQVDASGCPVDSDGDGVADYLDKCANTPAGAKVDAIGCALDSDGDGVADYLDKCANTPANAKVDAAGCPVDTDGDGVTDDLDKCPNTSANMKVDASGCPMDADADGVADYLDKCPNTPKGVKVDNTGCSVDSDKDGVSDDLDKCPTVPGTAENHGCPVVKKEVLQLFEKALQGIKFETGKAIIKRESNPILDAVVKVMLENPTYKLLIGGHTDNVGTQASNMTLSKNRAEAVANYLIAKEVSPLRISATGFGDTMPVDDNKTAAGKARNRRVELKVEFMEKVEVGK